MKCQSLNWATLIGAPEWGECHNEATVTLRFVPAHLRAECKAAGTTKGREEVFEVCETCLETISTMLEDEINEGWASFDE